MGYPFFNLIDVSRRVGLPFVYNLCLFFIGIGIDILFILLFNDQFPLQGQIILRGRLSFYSLLLFDVFA